MRSNVRVPQWVGVHPRERGCLREHPKPGCLRGKPAGFGVDRWARVEQPQVSTMNDVEFSRRQALGRLGLMAAGAAAATPPMASASEGTSSVAGAPYNVRDFKAVGDGKAKDSPAIQTAINAASAAGGGTVLGAQWRLSLRHHPASGQRDPAPGGGGDAPGKHERSRLSGRLR